MKDLARDILMKELDIPKIHGEVDIRLKNPMTGKIVKQIKGENTFQSAVLAKGLRSLGTANSSVYEFLGRNYNYQYPWTELVGGIMLFKNSLSNAQYMQKGNKMQANGSYGVTNNSNPPELGSWNENESSVSSRAMTLVYDWTTSQANGAGGISSVALTSRIGGYIGYGNPSETVADSKRSFKAITNMKSIQDQNQIEFAGRVQMNNYLYQFSYNGTDKIMLVRKTHVPITQGSIFDWIADEYTDTEIDVSDLHYSFVAGMTSILVMCSEDKIYICPYTNYDDHPIQINGKMYLWEYDPANGEISEIELTNATGELMYFRLFSVSHGLAFAFDRPANKTHVFKISDGSYVGYIENVNNTSPSLISSDLPGGLTMVPIANPSGNFIRVYDPENRTCYPTNGAMLDESNMSNFYYYEPSTDTLNYYGRYSAYAFDNPLYLATNYNLPSSVQKDATMTMQVRYTLQEA